MPLNAYNLIFWACHRRTFFISELLVTLATLSFCPRCRAFRFNSAGGTSFVQTWHAMSLTSFYLATFAGFPLHSLTRHTAAIFSSVTQANRKAPIRAPFIHHVKYSYLSKNSLKHLFALRIILFTLDEIFKKCTSKNSIDYENY